MALAPSRYELLDRIAVGGMAEVFRAKAFGAHGFEKTLAIKRILPELANDPEFEERFIAEAKLAVELSHANVVQVLDFGRFGGTLFIAMELVSGLDLAALLKHYTTVDKRVPIPAAFQIAIEIVRGLSFAHQNDVVHRDVSPSNILLSKAGEVKIADFGIAVAMRKGDIDEGRIMGKWRYMSPEQTRGKKLSAPSDLFSAATVIYEIFAGAKLFPGVDSSEIIENIHCMEIPKLSELRPGVPVSLDEVLASALERDVNKRLASAADMLRALTEASYKSSIVATSIDVAEAVACAAESGVVGASLKPNAAVDDLIRKQLSEANQFQPSERHTAVVGDVGFANTQLQTDAETDGGTMIRRGVDDRGVTIWELANETVAAVPSALRSAEEARLERARKESAGRYEEADVSSDGLRRGVIYSAVAFSALIVVMIFFVMRGGPPSQRSVQALPGDASRDTPSEPDPTTQKFTIDSIPRGATVTLNGRILDEPTPVSQILPVGSEVQLKLTLAGHDDYVDSLLIEAAPIRYRPQLVAHKATLIVKTTPPGAVVFLDGVELGMSPLDLLDLEPGLGRALKLVLPDHKTVEMPIDLARDKPIVVTRTLKSTLAFGYVKIQIRDSWAQVSENGKVLGDAPKQFRLRVGMHKLRLYNKESGKKKRVEVEVLADRIKNYTFDL